METNKKVALIFIISLGIIFIPFFIYKLYKLDEFNQYPGKVIAIEKTNVTVNSFKGGSSNEIRYIPLIEYYTPKDTSSFSDGKLTFFSNYEIGDEVTVIERKDDAYKVSIYSFWYYYVSAPELILIFLGVLILFGFYVTFIDKEFSNWR